jgi:hypothetical protein
MRLLRFRVSDFRSVKDSEWIDAERVTALIGVNESGKTNLLLPLWKLNPAREGEIKPTSDYPKGYFGAVREKPGAYDFILADFAIPELSDELAAMTGVGADKLDEVQIGRDYEGRTLVRFPKHIVDREVDPNELIRILKPAADELNAMSSLAKEASVKTAIVLNVEEIGTSLAGVGTQTADNISGIVTTFKSLLPETSAPTSAIIPRFKRLIESLEAVERKLRAPPPQQVEGVHALVWKHVPRFVYYSNYGNLDSEIYLPHVVDNLKREDLGAREAAKARTLRVLFKFVRLEPEEILELGRDFQHPQGRQPTETEIAEIATQKRERTILLNSAGTELTKKFREWWKQGDYTFEFQADGDHFRIWVSDARRPEKVELEDRSSGLQWFLSFYLIFLVESERDHRNAILLLDEPGLSLHPLAQRDLSAFFENLAKTNQIIYTTHSPFLVDADMLDRVRKVFVAADGSTKASADLRRGNEDPRKSGATYAIYSALNMNVAESILYGCQPVIVEGPSDQHYLTTIKTLLIGHGAISPKREIVFPPSHGASNAKIIASILSGRDEQLPAVLLDGDAAGRKMARDLQNGLYQSEKGRIFITDTYVGFENSEIEDLFPPEFLVDVIDRWGRSAEIPFSDVVKLGLPIVPQNEGWAKSQDVALSDGWKVTIAREAKRRALAAPNLFEPKVLDRWKDLFGDLM